MPADASKVRGLIKYVSLFSGRWVATLRVDSMKLPTSKPKKPFYDLEKPRSGRKLTRKGNDFKRRQVLNSLLYLPHAVNLVF